MKDTITARRVHHGHFPIAVAVYDPAIAQGVAAAFCDEGYGLSWEKHQTLPDGGEEFFLGRRGWSFVVAKLTPEWGRMLLRAIDRACSETRPHVVDRLVHGYLRTSGDDTYTADEAAERVSASLATYGETPVTDDEIAEAENECDRIDRNAARNATRTAGEREAARVTASYGGPVAECDPRPATFASGRVRDSARASRCPREIVDLALLS